MLILSLFQWAPSDHCNEFTKVSKLSLGLSISYALLLTATVLISINFWRSLNNVIMLKCLSISDALWMTATWWNVCQYFWRSFIYTLQQLYWNFKQFSDALLMTPSHGEMSINCWRSFNDGNMVKCLSISDALLFTATLLKFQSLSDALLMTPSHGEMSINFWRSFKWQQHGEMSVNFWHSFNDGNMVKCLSTSDTFFNDNNMVKW